MATWELVWMVAGMALVTYVPRLIPFLLTKHVPLQPKVQQFLTYLPYAILGALIFPGILSSTGRLSSALAGMITAFVLAYLRVHLVLTVTFAVLIATVWP
ncbi:MAG: AzlD domain-containing protein [Candidatus Carbobacillus altaicus]|nr:AzlD domain-containing protein [Candidatus Carbobacillus altaicus]